MNIDWKEINGQIFSDERYEFVIYKDDNSSMWILNYSDRWTIPNMNFYLTVKNPNVNWLKLFAQIQANMYDSYWEKEKAELAEFWEMMNKNEL